ncbi:4Fe-4S binding protein [Deferribacter abyssi]|uniref:4Fe-4S binding protein n=1 Tax=Deferribacter abyssi TaxID=213806 RepID=UPI003C1D2E92
MRLVVADSERCVGCQSCMFACSRKNNEAGLSKTSLMVKSVGGIKNGFVIIVCRACEDPSCVKVCPTNALTKREKGGVFVENSKCIGCRYCLDACPIGAVFWDDEINKPMICSHCGYCVNFCPHGVLKMEKGR